MSRPLRKVRILSKLASAILKAQILKQRRPIFVGFYITTLCNLRCAYCCINVDGRFDDPLRQKAFGKEDAFRIIDELYDMGARWFFLLGGEPLMHKEIGDIVRYIVKKGILLHILTNGTLIEQKIDEIKPADGVCVSIDGGESATDKARGKGTFRRALRGVEVALSHGMQVRLHAMLNKYSIKDMEMLAKMAKDLGVTLTIAPLNYIGAAEHSDMEMTDEEYRDFYRRYRRLKEDGFPIGNSFFSIDKALRWPIGYHEFINAKHRFSDYKPIRCVIGDLHGCIDAEGAMFNCVQMGCLNGLNIKEAGIKRAWEDLPNRRPNCVSCASVNTIETSAYLTLRPEIILDGFRFFFAQNRKRKK